jgi:hypothetical protein
MSFSFHVAIHIFCHTFDLSAMPVYCLDVAVTPDEAIVRDRGLRYSSVWEA